MPPEIPFAGPYLDRRAEARLRTDWLAEARGDEHTLYIGMRQGAALVRHPAGDPARLAFLTGSDPRIAAADEEHLVLLGWYEERRCVLVDLPSGVDVENESERFEELRPLAADLPAGEASLMAYARALNLWKQNHRYCGQCGSPTLAIRAGHARTCGACGQTSFPRLDPAIIVLVHDGERALLGRQASWQPGRYSTIAGFVEPGESLEDAVRREVLEETGVPTHDIRYHASQPWPFPSSLMLGFIARAHATTPVMRDGELEDARWFTREALLAGEVKLPPETAISRRLIDAWLHHGA